jgi:hypothetical protein
MVSPDTLIQEPSFNWMNLELTPEERAAALI